MKNRYRDTIESIQVPKELNRSVLQAARQGGSVSRTDRCSSGSRHPVLRFAVCAACALALVAGTIRLPSAPWAPPESPAPAFSFGLIAYAADTGETVLPNANGGLALLSGAGVLDPQWGGFTGSLFRITGSEIRHVSLSVSKGGLYRCKVHTDLTAQERTAFRRAMEQGDLVPAAISQDASGSWSMPEMTALGSSVSEDYDPEAQYGFWVPPEELVTNSGTEEQDRFHANVDFFDGAELTVTVTLDSGAKETRSYRLSTGRLKAVRDQAGTLQVLPQLAGETEPYLYGIYAADVEKSRFFQWPLQGSRTISLSNPYGSRSRDSSRAGAFHAGIDIPAQAGEAVLAAADGTVAETGFDRVTGRYLVLDHGDGLTTLYGCCQETSRFPEIGASVSAGDQIAAAGSTGMSTGPHLHFEVRQDGQPQNPVTYFDSDIRDTLEMGDAHPAP